MSEGQLRILAYLEERGIRAEIRQFGDTHSAELAAEALGVSLAQIAKSLLFAVGDGFILVLVAGDRKVDQKLLRSYVGTRPRLADPEQVLTVTGYPVGAVAPVALATPLRVLLDQSLDRFETIWSSGGTSDSLMALSFADLPRLTGGELVDVTAER